MKLKKRKIKSASIFFVCWFALWVLIVDGIIGFQTLLDKAEYEPAHTAGFDTRQTLCSNTCCQNLDMKK